MKITDRQFVITGWLLFIVSSLAFIWSSLESGDIPGLIGASFFLLACLVFLIPYIRRTM